MIAPFFSLRKSKRTFRLVERHYRRKKKRLDQQSREIVQNYLIAFRDAILKKDSAAAKQMAKELEQASLRLMPKSLFDQIRDFTGGILFALAIAVLIRTMWFELYTIPSGSMRPTLKEEDYLVVSKTDYGINIPLQEAHFYFDPTLIKRGSIVVFNGGGMDIEDSETTYFYLFPGKKQFVKRLIGKPGDTIYFYGGEVYGIDVDGNWIADLKQVNQIEHIPYIRFDGKVETPNGSQNGVFPSVIFHQMNQPVAKLAFNPIGTISGELFLSKTHYSDLWGMKHYAMARLLTQSELEKIHPGEKSQEGLLYLELTHHPTIQGALLVRDEYNRLRPELGTSTSIIPLQDRHLEAISRQMTTCRFKIKEGVAWRLGWNPKNFTGYLPKFPGVPDGTYEIQNGKVYQLPFPTIPIIGIFTNGYANEVAADHPLYKQDPEMIQKLYNLGIEFLNYYNPIGKNQRAVPSRYAYFRNGDLYLMGDAVISKEDPFMQSFIAREKERASISTSYKPYFPFIDLGAPTLEEVKKNGIVIPDKMYMVLGDNHAMSADSRQFGFVPEENLKGGVSFLFSPPGERWGRALQPPIAHLTVPNLIVWALFIAAVLSSFFYYRRKLHPTKKALDQRRSRDT